ncbi:hypothetical protein EPI10_006567 [Gossypium australe]|uniref:Uncharacterized protein n=1 Tax=Gossypium australe TaxID=47621 RepID=A0A5B6WTU8_9ROSI|nr:hypothetical protein EPI10_006567 [Gossypium australe]
MATSAEHLCIGPSLTRNRFTGLTGLMKLKKRSTKFVCKLEKKRDQILDPSHVISLTEVKIRPDITYGEEPIKILAREFYDNDTKSKMLRGNLRKLCENSTQTYSLGQKSLRGESYNSLILGLVGIVVSRPQIRHKKFHGMIS